MLLALILFGLAADALGGRGPPPCQAPKPTCGDNQKYVVNSNACQKTCSNRFVFDKNGPCKPFTGCVCTGDLSRVNADATGACIPDCQCKSSCGKQEQYVEKSTACRKTCANRNSLNTAGACKPYTGCVCKNGLVRLNDDATGPCVPESKCTPKTPTCGDNQKYVVNSNACQKTCSNRFVFDKNGPCKPFTGCVCTGNLSRVNDDATGACIPDCQCKSSCGKQEQYVEKSTACRKTCANRNSLNTAGACKPYTGCVCQKGLVRLNDDATGPCVPESKCSPAEKCGYNEVWSTQKKYCPPDTCTSLNGVALPCAPPPKTPGCNCKDNYLRNSSGICIPISECPPRPAEKCGYNEVWSDQKKFCPPETCESLNGPPVPCALPPKKPGCNCIENHLRNSSGICIPISECPPHPAEQCGYNEVWSDQKKFCPPETCESLNGPALPCALPPKTPGCNCIDDHLRNSSGICIPIAECPPRPAEQCGYNEIWSEQKIFCPPQSCESLYYDGPVRDCAYPPQIPGCNCMENHLRNSSGICVPIAECPPRPAEKCGYNEMWSEQKIFCPPQTCESLYYDGPVIDCANPPQIPGCNCMENHLRNSSGICVPIAECPPRPADTCGYNEIWSEQKRFCPPETCEIRYTDVRLLSCPNPPSMPGCNCIENHLRNSSGICIPVEECPPPPAEECGYNEVWSQEKRSCPPEICESQYIQYPCAYPVPRPGCNCIENHLRNSSGICIPIAQCPPRPLQCGKNEVESDNKIICPPQSCEIIYSTYPVCDPPPPKERGCNCIDGYLRNATGVCIPSNECIIPGGNPDPNSSDGTWENYSYGSSSYESYESYDTECGNNGGPRGCNGDPNATNKKCPNPCPPTCDNPNPSGVCARACLATGCECNFGYVLSKEGKCILPKQCPVKPSCNGDPNATAKECPNACPPTCDNKNPGPCIIAACLPLGCECNPGYVLSKEGKCILPNQCPVQPGCNGDRNATAKECPSACPATCDNLNPSGACIEVCLASGCQCNPGYVLSKEGKCILPKDCPVKTCSANEQFANCKVECPNSFCPVNDNRGILICDPPRPCPSGCICNTGYLRKSQKEKVCIEASQCPPVKCTRQNEVWSPTPPKCLLERCEDANKPAPVCDKPYRDYTPKCVCRQGFYRNDSDICVPVCECPQPGCKGDPNATNKSCPNPCPPTCDNPKPSGVCNRACLATGCECNPGYVLSKEGKCILPNQCPVKPGCNGDPNATTKECPNACPPTCDNPKPSGACIQMCLASGCECNPGYVLSKEGKCILPNQCPVVGCNGDRNATAKDCPSTCQPTCDNPNPSGVCNKMCLESGCVCNPGYLLTKEGGKCILQKDCPVKTCSANEQFVNCKVECPNSYCPVNDNRGILICDPPRPCPSGCVCSTGYLRKSQKEKVCIEASTCPPVKCTRQNEVWSPTPPKCLLERCEDANKPAPVCDKPYRDYTPKCVCQQGFYRNDSDICVPASECPFKCPTPAQCRPTCAVPNPPNCPAVEPATSNVDGCQCQKGYILSEAGGKCIRIEECPQNQGCNGDPNAVATSCPWACPATCGNPKTELCEKKCLTVGCQCAPGYIISEKNGKCILPTDCNGGDPCGPNGTFVDCGFRCPNQYCPADDSNVQIACKPGRPCPPGCACKLNYKRLSYEDDRCILAPDCPVRECKRPNEVWAPCPSECLAEECSNVNDPPSVCNTLVLNCQPKCICQEDYYRNSSGICVPAKQCPDYNPCLAKCAPTCAQPNPWDCTRQPAVKCCEDGFILSKRDGKCIRIEDCPRNGTCNGDPNAIVKQCPAPCPSTCESPNQFNCKRACLSIGCECAPGYLRSEPDGQCIKPTECPGGNPCRANETFVGCRGGCPTDYCPVDDSRAQVICETSPFAPCYSGCICKVNHKKKSRDDDRCIMSSECPPVKCTRQNEEWSSCPEPCLRESCSDVGKKPVICNTLLLNCNPRCVCTKNHYRNKKDICVSPGCCN